MSLTLVAAWTRARRALEAAGVSTPVLDARALVEGAAGVQRIEILTDPHREIDQTASDRLEALTARRAAREPLAYVLGVKEFWSMPLEVDPAVLCPRPETETVVQAGLDALGAEDEARVLDLGVGSGAILLAILKERPNARGVGVDLSEDALRIAERNAVQLGLAERAHFVGGNWGAGLEGPFDLIVSNPPYIASGEIDTLEPEVSQWEPRLALDGGADGLDAYRAIARDIARLLRPAGRFALEIGQGQEAAVADILRGQGLSPDATLVDLAGVNRVVPGGKP
jgi:release factor glutamine methyltransferase